MSLFKKVLLHFIWIGWLSFTLFSRAASAEDVLHVYNWNDYIGPTAIAQFEKECHCRVEYDTFGDSDELLARLESRTKIYDVLVPTGNAVETLIKSNRLKPIDKTNLPKIKNTKAEFLNLAFDKGNVYSVPYGYSLTVLGFNEEKLQSLNIPTNTFAALFDPRYLEKLRGKVTVLDSPNELFAAALKYKGYAANDIDPRHWAEAKQIVIAAKPYWQAFNNQTYGRGLVNGSIWLALGYSNDFFQASQRAKRENRKWHIGFAVPREGAVFALDNMVIHKNSPRADLAHKFINFNLGGNVAAELSNTTGSGSPNSLAMGLLDPLVANNRGIYPDNQTMKKLEMLTDLPKEQRRARMRLWTEIKMKHSN